MRFWALIFETIGCGETNLVWSGKDDCLDNILWADSGGSNLREEDCFD